MIAVISHFFASVVNVPDSGTAGLLLGAAVVSLGLFSRFVKNRSK